MRTVEASEVCKFVLRPPSFRSKVTNARTQPPLNLFTLQQEQFRGILLKRILLIRRVADRKRDLGFNSMAEEVPAPTIVPWDEVQGAASLAFHTWAEQPELAWAKSAWQVLTEAKLTTYRSELERYEVLFRLLVLGGIYSDFCDAAWEERSDPDYSSWAEPMKLDSFLLGQLYARLPTWNPENDKTAYQALDTLVENQRQQVVTVLMAAHGGSSGLYASFWRTQHAEGEEREDDDAYDLSVGQQAGYSWVEQGCCRYR